jgi:hypothetical protein
MAKKRRRARVVPQVVFAVAVSASVVPSLHGCGNDAPLPETRVAPRTAAPPTVVPSVAVAPAPPTSVAPPPSTTAAEEIDAAVAPPEPPPATTARRRRRPPPVLQGVAAIPHDRDRWERYGVAARSDDYERYGVAVE